MKEPDIYRDPDVAQFYDIENGREARGPRADFAYCTALAADAASILDLGCGTGELAVALANGRVVTGVDPAEAVIEISRHRPGGENVTWVLADAQSVRLGSRFDFVILTGHAFQVLLTRDDQRAVLATIAEHLAPGGRFIFDSRNPGYPGHKERTRDETLHWLDHPELGKIEAWNESTYDQDTAILTYRNSFRIHSTGEIKAASAQIHYTPQEELAAMIEGAGLAVESWLGDWHGNPFHPDAKDIIPFGGLA